MVVSMSAPDLSRRAKKILQAVVSEYLHSGDAVGSRTVTRRHDIGLSPATVRNVMADLEELGLLEQRHNYLNSLLSGLTLDEVRARVQRELGDEKHRYDTEVATALRLGEQVFAVAEPRIADVVISGQSNLVDPETAGDKARLDRM